MEGLGVVYSLLFLLVVTTAVAYVLRKPITDFFENRSLYRDFSGSDAEPFEGVEAGESFRHCETAEFCPEMTILPRGEFLMGGRGPFPEASESPTRVVSINYDIAVGTFEVTQAQWQLCESLPAPESNLTCPQRSDPNTMEDAPIFNVSWHDAQIYLNWLNEVIGIDDNGYRLPSESEWEYSIRAETEVSTDTVYYFWGNSVEDACQFGNVVTRDTLQDYGLIIDWRVLDCDDGYVEAASGGKFEANDFGLFDMAGNIAEWTLDCWHDDYEGAPTNGSAWLIDAPRLCDRVLRGGSWLGPLDRLRSGSRFPANPNGQGRNIGFRVALEL